MCFYYKFIYFFIGEDTPDQNSVQKEYISLEDIKKEEEELNELLLLRQTKLNQTDEESSATSDSSDEAESSTEEDENEVDDQEKKLRKNLKTILTIERPNVQWQDIVGLDLAKKELQEAIIWPLKFPKLYEKEIKTSNGILLFG